jgi:predicted DNA-binding transcriptional regulator YafY
MTKAERLLHIINLFRVRKRITLEQLAEECNVSKRTVYRDLDSLSMLNIPIYCDNGYTLARDITLPPLNFTTEELEIIGYCLGRCALKKSPRFGEILKKIELKIASVVPGQKPEILNRKLLADPEKYRLFTRKQDNIINTFFNALLFDKPVEFTFADKRRPGHEFIPVGLVVAGSRWSFKVKHPESHKSRVFPVNRIKSIKIPASRKS